MTRPDAKTPMPNPDQRPRLSGITDEWAAWMAHRSQEIYHATQRKGTPGYSWSYPKPAKKS